MKLIRTSFRIFTLSLAIMSSSEAALSTYSFSGLVSAPGGTVLIGSSFSGQFTIDVGQAGGGPDINGKYYSYQMFEVYMGQEHLRYYSGSVNVDNNGPFAGDRVDVEFGAGIIGGLPFTHGRFRLVDTTNLAIDSTALPFNEDLAPWQFKEIRFYAQNVDIIGNITQLTYTLVPEPSSSFLVILGSAFVVLRRNRHLHRNLA